VPPRSSARTATDEAEDYTGALPDDAGPVKQLCGMGFTRQAVINALEKSNYRTEKALERLLASTN
jgi:epidermal growth factor receptor substrate 15